MFPRYFLLFIFLICCSKPVLKAQDTLYARRIIESLCSPSMKGRGCLGKGDVKASAFIRRELKNAGIPPLDGKYYQKFSLSVNTFPSKIELTVNGKELTAGQDFIVRPASGSAKGIFDIRYAPDDLKVQADLSRALIIKPHNFQAFPDSQKIFRESLSTLFAGAPRAPVIIEISHDKLLFGVSTKANKIPYFVVKSSSWPDSSAGIKVNIKNRMLKNHQSRNVMGFLKGQSDSVIVFTAHYDHLGKMGDKVYFPGANDNASGISMLLSLARSFVHEGSKYSVLFLAVSGEEAGLLGSQYFVDHPPFMLDRIKFMINLDLVGNGEDGISVVNGDIFTKQLKLLLDISEANHYFTSIRSGGPSCNSDHCPFYSKGIPSFFIFTRGKSTAYHDVNDTPGELTLSGFVNLNKLLVTFVNAL